MAIGRKGKKNCLVTGMRREANKAVAMAVFTTAPGDLMTHSEKMPMIASNKYCAS